MAAFSAKDVQRLREMTGVGMMECKRALSEAEGDFDKAIDMLRERGLATAAKKAGRIASEGIVSAAVENGVGAIIEVNAETDFVAKNESFRAFVALCLERVIGENPADVDALLRCPAPAGTIEDELREKILTIGENIKIRRFVRYEGILVPYIHGGGTHAVLVQFDVDGKAADSDAFQAFGKDIAMQIAAANPLYINRDSVPGEELEKEREILLAQAINEGKPQNIAEKMVAGRISKYYKEVALLEQPYIKDDKQSVADVVASVGKEIGAPISIKAFSRYEKGEGLEKRSCDFAAEVASMTN